MTIDQIKDVFVKAVIRHKAVDLSVCKKCSLFDDSISCWVLNPNITREDVYDTDADPRICLSRLTKPPAQCPFILEHLLSLQEVK